MQNIEDLIRKYNLGRCTPEEKILLEQWYQFFDLSNKSDNLNSSEIDKIKEEVWLASQNNLVTAKKETGIAKNSLKSLWSSLETLRCSCGIYFCYCNCSCLFF